MVEKQFHSAKVSTCGDLRRAMSKRRLITIFIQSLRPGPQRTQRDRKPALTWVASSLAAGIFLFASCGTPQNSGPAAAFFNEEDKADIVIRYYSDTVSRILKPKQMEGEFLSTFDMNGTLEMARHQPGRELAVVILIYFNGGDNVKLKWAGVLKDMGYRRVVFLRGREGPQINGLSILENPPAPARTEKPPQSKATLSSPTPAASTETGKELSGAAVH